MCVKFKEQVGINCRFIFAASDHAWLIHESIDAVKRKNRTVFLVSIDHVTDGAFKGSWLPRLAKLDGSRGPICVQSCYKSDDDYIVRGRRIVYVHFIYTHTRIYTYIYICIIWIRFVYPWLMNSYGKRTKLGVRQFTTRSTSKWSSLVKATRVLRFLLHNTTYLCAIKLNQSATSCEIGVFICPSDEETRQFTFISIISPILWRKFTRHLTN